MSDINLARPMRIAIEGSELTVIDFEEILDVLKRKIVEYYCNRLLLIL